MQLLFVIVVLAAVLSAELVAAEPVEHGHLRVMGSAATIGMVMLFAQIAAGVTTIRLKSDFGRRSAFMQAFTRWKTIHLLLWAAGSLTILYGLEWTRLVRVNWQLADTFLLDEALILLPVLAPLLVSWAAFYEVDRTLNRTPCSATTSRLATEAWWSGCIRYVATHVRHHLGLLLVPLLLIVVFQDSAHWLFPDLAGRELPLLAYVPLLVGIVVALPLLLRCVWPTEPLPAGDLRSRLEDVGCRLDVSVREIYVWKTNRMITNAAVAGLLPRLRYVFLSDSLLASVSHEQIAAIYAHELGHVRHRHLPLRVMLSLLPLVVWLALCATFPTAMVRLDDAVANMGWPLVAASPLLLLAAMAVFARTVLARYSRLLEHQADWEACAGFAGENTVASGPESGREKAGNLDVNTEPLVESLLRLTILSGHSVQRRSWLHPSTDERIHFLRAMAVDEQLREAFASRMRRLARLSVLLMAMAIAWWSAAALL